MNEDRRVFDFLECPFVGISTTLLGGKNTVTEGCVKIKAYVRPHVIDVFVMRRVVKQEVLEFIIPCGMKKWFILR